MSEHVHKSWWTRQDLANLRKTGWMWAECMDSKCKSKFMVQFQSDKAVKSEHNLMANQCPQGHHKELETETQRQNHLRTCKCQCIFCAAEFTRKTISSVMGMLQTLGRD